MSSPIIPYQVEKLIFLIRGHKVILDEDLARIYGGSTKRLNEQVRRNLRRFPPDFMFRLRAGESKALRPILRPQRESVVVGVICHMFLQSMGR